MFVVCLLSANTCLLTATSDAAVPSPRVLLMLCFSDAPPVSAGKPPPPGTGLEEEQPLAGDSESDSMAEYEDTDPTKFNEDGSFIGTYMYVRHNTMK